MHRDKQTEYRRYDTRAKEILASGGIADASSATFGAAAISPALRAPYVCYEQCIRRYIAEEHSVLELGSGTGLHTYALVRTGARVVASDISSHSLDVLQRRIQGRLTTMTGDMEALSFDDESFDVICSAGSLSYGDPELVNAEIIRLLRPDGFFICVDSLNHNPIYRLNRWLHYLRGERTQSTMVRMPTIGRIQSISNYFDNAEVRYFGSVSYLMPIVSRIAGQEFAARFSDTVDRVINVRRSAFKFVLVARGLR